jgi:hypothetical protein
MQKPPLKGGLAPGHRSDRGDMQSKCKPWSLLGQLM